MNILVHAAGIGWQQTWVYVHNFIKAYARILELEPHDLIDRYQKEKKLFYTTKGLKQKKVGGILRKQTIKGFDMLIVPRIIKGLLIAVLLGMVFSYIVLSVKQMNEAPLLAVDYPENNIIIEDTSIIIKGFADREAQVTINGVDTLLDSQGLFTKELNLKKGKFLFLV